MPTVKYGSTVQVHYTALRKNGAVVESTAGGDPLRVTVGLGRVMRGLEEALEGMSAGESKRVTVPPDKAYGRRDPSAVSRFSRESAPIGGSATEMQQEVVDQGTTDEFSFVSTDKGVSLDRNPQLAGEEIVLQIDVVEIEHT
ncbi:FKBP-type peptidyl-prolyl cis-trans isomerase [Geomonas subterranea]|uniref:Peptidyl-prolyl cis-trans isomerase n=1 Tax=Geomonas subterranea TaxID=2847989 RepID=A0ABX8LL76_9BACT|nr:MULTISPECIES: FKBP-type peptidyl-prolyl cis-trans isomerase [Geomonas]QXE91074.1 FKBP-type peptidyl-prolyl cis-trans isomerase [Geomonas subterranea]QXM10840.1 FKBP-type peptidyl-prolyl cis-trans isomerase [Geomonas subterranea]